MVIDAYEISNTIFLVLNSVSTFCQQLVCIVGLFLASSSYQSTRHIMGVLDTVIMISHIVHS